MKNGTTFGYGFGTGMGLIFACLGIGLLYMGINLNLDDTSVLLICGGVFTLVGTILTAIFAVLLSRDYADRQLLKMLKQNGDCLIADITNIDVNYNIQINNQPVYVIYCTALLPNGQHCNFESSAILYNPKNPPREDKVAVWVDKDNIDLYYVDPQMPIENIL